LKKYTAEQIRNLALVGHGGAGKTSLAESLLFKTGGSSRRGRVEEGNTVSDYDPEEIRRKVSISTSIVPCEWKNHKLNLLDTPGFFDFEGEMREALRVAELALVVVRGKTGVEVGTEKVWEYAAKLPKMVFVNKMDRENADFGKALASLRKAFGTSLVALQLPIGKEASFSGIVDLVAMKGYRLDGSKREEISVPPELQTEAQSLHEQLLEAVAVTDEDLMERYLGGEDISTDELARAVKIGVRQGDVIPVLCGSTATGVGIEELLDALVAYGPSPLERAPEVSVQGAECKPDGPLAALVFKTTADPFVGKLTFFRVFGGTLRSDSQVFNANRKAEERMGQLFVQKGKEQQPATEIVAGDLGAVAKLAVTVTGDTLTDKGAQLALPGIDFPHPVLTMAVEPKTKGDEDKIAGGLARLLEEDPTIKMERRAETRQLLVSGMGELHLEILSSRLQKKFGVGVELAEPKVPYRETIRGKAKVEGKHKKQSGGRGQFGHVWLELEPLTGGEEFEFVDKIFGGAVPRQYIPAVEKGVRETMAEGILAGCPVVGVRVILYDGSYHPVDSSEMAFKIAASLAFKKGFLDAQPILLEPIMSAEVTVPEEFMGDIIGDLNKKRGRILGVEPQGRLQVIKAQAPQAELFRYAIDLRSMTQGRGSFSLQFDHYEEVPGQIAQKIIEAANEKIS
jgi:elongation factor G